MASDPGRDGVFLSADRLEAEAEAGIWPDKVILDDFDRLVERRPDALALVAYRCEDDEERRFTYGELHGAANRLAANLKQRGIGRGDVVSYQLPNWWQFVAITLACLRVGAICNPLMPMFRERELRFMVGFAESKALIVPKLFRGFDHETLGRKMLAELSSLRHLFVIGGEGEHGFEEALLAHCDEAEAMRGAGFGPNDVFQLLYTSGTTGEPKGVLHTSNTLLGSIVGFAERMRLSEDDVVFMPSPTAHQTGFTYGIQTSIMIGAPLVLMDIWKPDVAARLIERHGVTYTFAATPFLADLANLPGVGERDLSRFRLFATAGAPIPPSLVTAAERNLGVSVVTGWGMTEVGVATATELEDAKVLTSDGRGLRGSEHRVVDGGGRPVAPGVTGELQYRGSNLFVGYFKRPELYALDDEGWLDTGDLARMDEEGYVRIVGRSKDLIIRGGENVPVVEVENLIHEMPEVADVALVAMPDERLGEKGCAFVTLNDGHDLDLAELARRLEAKGLARPYLPERIEVIEEMPRTPSGKIQKFELRQRAKAFGEA